MVGFAAGHFLLVAQLGRGILWQLIRLFPVESSRTVCIQRSEKAPAGSKMRLCFGKRETKSFEVLLALGIHFLQGKWGHCWEVRSNLCVRDKETWGLRERNEKAKGSVCSHHHKSQSQCDTEGYFLFRQRNCEYRHKAGHAETEGPSLGSAVHTRDQ